MKVLIENFNQEVWKTDVVLTRFSHDFLPPTIVLILQMYERDIAGSWKNLTQTFHDCTETKTNEAAEIECSNAGQIK